LFNKRQGENTEPLFYLECFAMTRINVPLDKLELAALLSMATADCRHPREQMRFVLREEARRRGLLPTDPAPAQAEAQPQEAARVEAAQPA
jgi:hypothetical protein